VIGSWPLPRIHLGAGIVSAIVAATIGAIVLLLAGQQTRPVVAAKPACPRN